MRSVRSVGKSYRSIDVHHLAGTRRFITPRTNSGRALNVTQHRANLADGPESQVCPFRYFKAESLARMAEESLEAITGQRCSVSERRRVQQQVIGAPACSTKVFIRNRCPSADTSIPACSRRCACSKCGSQTAGPVKPGSMAWRSDRSARDGHQPAIRAQRRKAPGHRAPSAAATRRRSTRSFRRRIGKRLDIDLVAS